MNREKIIKEDRENNPTLTGLMPAKNSFVLTHNFKAEKPVSSYTKEVSDLHERYLDAVVR